jgi:glycosyltransferase involved in cell wall biosynthesis
MKVLWLSGNPGLYASHKTGYNGGGWIGALEAIIKQQENVELGIAFFYDDDCFKNKIDGTTYYPISIYNTKIEKVKHNLFYEKYDHLEIQKIKRILDDFKPDVIHVWGSELSFGLIAKYTDIPMVIHIQGILNPYKNVLFIPGVSMLKFITSNGSSIFRWILNVQALRFWKHNSKREIEIFKNSKYFIGRTHWDKSIASLLSPNASYFYCSELLRSPFYIANSWKYHEREKFIITSVLSNPSYKGIDLVLKCAHILKTYHTHDFEWNIFGVSECRFAEKLTKIKASEVSVKLHGIANADLLIEELQNSSMYVHTSYIDNSPNSVCEAQMLGMPVIATNVGGVSSLIENSISGILVPANDPFYLASQIIGLFKNSDRASHLGENARKTAMKRHDKEAIKKDLLQTYNTIFKVEIH